MKKVRFNKFSADDFANTDGEILVYIKAFDDMFSNTVVARSSYTLKEIIIGAKFLPMYHRDEVRKHTVLDLDKINNFHKADISFAFATDSSSSVAS